MAKKGISIGWLAWLLPLTYLAHFAEEYVGNFPAWLNRFVGADLSGERFLELNGFFWVGMVVGVLLATMLRPARLILVALATIVVVNSALHVGGTVITGSYSPGAATGLALWLPLGVTLLRRLAKELARLTIAVGIAIGLALHGLVSLAAIR